MAKKEDLILEADALGIKLTGTEKVADIEGLIAKARAGSAGADDELSPAEIAKLEEDSKSAEAKRLAMEEARKAKALEQDKKEGLFTKAEVEEMMAKMKAELRAEMKGAPKEEDLDEVDPYAQKKLTIPRFPRIIKNADGTNKTEWKFVTHFANTNSDEYFKDKEILAFDVWDDMQKKNVAYVKAVFEDDSEMTLPLFTLIKKSQKVLVDIIDIPKKNTSYSAGKTEIARVDGYNRKVEGTVTMKVTQFAYSFKVKVPATAENPQGKELNVSKDVVNWAIIPEK